MDPSYLQMANTTGNPTLLSRPERVLAKENLLHKLNISECITAYANDPQTSWGDVVVVVDIGHSSIVPPTPVTPHLFGAKYMDCPTDPYGWSKWISYSSIILFAKIDKSAHKMGKTHANVQNQILAPESVRSELHAAKTGYKVLAPTHLAGGPLSNYLLEPSTLAMPSSFHKFVGYSSVPTLLLLSCSST